MYILPTTNAEFKRGLSPRLLELIKKNRGKPVLIKFGTGDVLKLVDHDSDRILNWVFENWMREKQVILPGEYKD